MCELCHKAHIPIYILDGRFNKLPYHMPNQLYFYNDYIFIEAIYLYSMSTYPPPFKDFLKYVRDNIMDKNTGVRCVEIAPDDILRCTSNYLVNDETGCSTIQIDSHIIKFAKDKNVVKKIYSDKLLYDYLDERNKMFRS